MLRVTQSWCARSWRGAPGIWLRGQCGQGSARSIRVCQQEWGRQPSTQRLPVSEMTTHLLPAGREEGPPWLCPLPGPRPSSAQTPWQSATQARKNNGQKGNSALPSPPSVAHCLSLPLKLSKDSQKLAHKAILTAPLGHQAFLFHKVG